MCGFFYDFAQNAVHFSLVTMHFAVHMKCMYQFIVSNARIRSTQNYPHMAAITSATTMLLYFYSRLSLLSTCAIFYITQIEKSGYFFQPSLIERQLHTLKKKKLLNFCGVMGGNRGGGGGGGQYWSTHLPRTGDLGSLEFRYYDRR